MIADTLLTLYLHLNYLFSIETFHDRGPCHTENSPLIWGANQWTGFYMIATSGMRELKMHK